jgi:hypothetical protein
MATNTPPVPLACPFDDRALYMPAAQDWNKTKTDRTIEIIPITNFAVFIFLTSSLFFYHTLMTRTNLGQVNILITAIYYKRSLLNIGF